MKSHKITSRRYKRKRKVHGGAVSGAGGSAPLDLSYLPDHVKGSDAKGVRDLPCAVPSPCKVAKTISDIGFLLFHVSQPHRYA
ncbi:MAG: hypothetical protein OXC30_02660 [Alphaproteobacteria bacterium]|nr:hypothetical protein [Alphaproteobacteria bacterium]